MRFNYTKTMLLIVAAQFVLRIPLTYTIDAKPFVTGGVFWAGVAMVVMLIPIGLGFDLVSGLRSALRSRRASGRLRR